MDERVRKPKLKTIRPQVGKLAPLLRNQAGDERTRSRFRDETQHWRRWYKTSRWQKLRWDALVRDHFTCQMCKRIEADTSKLVGDHKVKHDGDPALFWDIRNIQCLCASCHDSEKQKQERRYR